ncbi:hypothetical protein JWJ90_14635 [Desulfobulbus rhabdoformis]|uniref:hypothetical protein n=1 Tax=Desulfobulbus rhabdoformis TaxID=34032 RepID=UPI001964A7B5|nr:hypothetical protein [Desulfobulbus rhabdoformis]MBM9615518.1 hypothetical protein [Desulfobulbus rhabdoformis]
MISVELDSSKIKKHALYQWADFVELACLMDDDGEAPLGEILREAWGFETGLATSFACDDEETDPLMDRSEHEDAVGTKLEDLAKHFQLREDLLRENYPFTMDLETLVLSRKEFTEAHRLYVYLLRSANLSFHTRSDRSNLTKGFERIAYHAVEELIPSKATVALFGTASHDAYKCYTGMRKYEKLCAFANDMGTCINDYNITEDTYPDQDSGDDGLDVAAWYPFDDYAAHFPLILAQAGCTADEKEMIAKQHEVHPRTWTNKIRNIIPVAMMITPQCYRDASSSRFIRKPSKCVGPR